jgi:hypothetical protein
MRYRRRDSLLTVQEAGAPAGSILWGSGTYNDGLRLRVLEAQPRGALGAIRGGFVILDTGHNKHSEALRPLLQRTTDAEEVAAAIRREHAACVNVANTNILVAEQHAAPNGQVPDDPSTHHSRR